MRDSIQQEASKMTSVRVAAVQAGCVLMDQAATLNRVAALTAEAAAQGAQLVAFPEVFVPGTPIWIDTRPIWDGDEDWFRLLAENAVVVPGPAIERLPPLRSGQTLDSELPRQDRRLSGGRREAALRRCAIGYDGPGPPTRRGISACEEMEQSAEAGELRIGPG
jgi:hypothetical protein